MRIAYFAPHFAEYAVRLALAQAERGPVWLAVNLENLAQECTPALVEQARARLRLVTFRARTRAQRLVSYGRLAAAMAAFRPDVIHVQEQTDYFVRQLAQAASLMAPVLLTVHDPKPHIGADADWAVRMTPHREALRALAAAFHVHGAHCRRELAASLQDGRPIISTQHGEILLPEPGQARAPERRRLLMFGRMEAYKGLGTLLEAVAILRREGVPFELRLAGRGSELDRLQGAVEADPSITAIRKYLSVGEAVAEFQSASAVVLPYLEATQSGVVAAAFGNHRPVLATHVGGLVDSVRPGITGTLVPPADPAALAGAIRRLLDDDAHWQALMDGVAAWTGDFHWSAVCDALEPAYRGLMASGRRGRERQARRPELDAAPRGAERKVD